MPDQVSVTREVDASAAEVWAMVSDITRMGEWSPENEGARWTGGATGPRPGAGFRGVNRKGSRTWRTAGRVVASDPGRLFSFRITVLGLPSSEWQYHVESTAGGCRVTETWGDQRGTVVRLLGRLVTGVDHDAAYTRDGMEQTLEHLKAAAEAGRHRGDSLP
jgi:uncharacterized protein YndB with AHSA1/START domain